MGITAPKVPRLAPLVIALMAASPACRADWKFTPIMGLTETWTDNVALQGPGQAREAWVTDLAPGFSLVGRTPRVRLNAMYEWHSFVYGGERPRGTYDSQRHYLADAQARLVGEALFLDASASHNVQAISAFGPQVNGNLWAMGNRAEISSWRISPWFRHQFGGSAVFTARYSRDSVDAGRNLIGTSEGETVSANLSSGRSFHTVGWSLDYNRQDLDNKLGGPSSSETAAGSLRVRLSRTLAATSSVGYDRYDFQSLGGSNAGRNWSAGLIWTPGTRTQVAAAWGHRYFGPSGSLSASHRTRRSVWSVQYSDAITTMRSQVLLPTAIDTAAMLEQLFMPSIPDPVARQQAVMAYLQATGLPPSLADSVTYLSNRYLRQKQLQAAAVFNGAHGTLMLSVFDSRRNALSVEQTNSELLGSQLGEINRDTRQQGASAVWNYRLSPRSAALASLTASHNVSLTTGRVDNNKVLRLGLTRNLGGRLRGALELRRSHGGSLADPISRTYTENAVSATLSMQL